MNTKRYLGIVTTVLAVAVGGTAMAATLPEGQKTGASPQSSGALVTLAIPSVIGVNVAHNFVLDFNSATKCWGSGSTQGTFPQAATGTTTYTFAVNAATRDSATQNVVCPGAGATADLATVQVFSTSATTSTFQAGITDGAQGAQATALTGLIADIFSATRLKLATSDTCGGGTVVSPHTMTVAAADYVTVIPKTGWANCRQTLSLALDPGTAVAAGTATGTLTFTITNP